MIGDIDDIAARLKGYLPPSWFGSDAPIVDGVVRGAAYAFAFVYSLYAYAKLQTRILTATDGWLDLIAADFFGSALKRIANQTDSAFRNLIIINLFRERATRAGIQRVLEDLTGRTPRIFEPQRPLDTGSYGGPLIGYGVAGGYGSLMLAYQGFVVAYRPSGTGIPNVIGYGASPGGYGVPSQLEYASLDMIIGGVSDSDIYMAIDKTKPAATVVWTRIES